MIEYQAVVIWAVLLGSAAAGTWVQRTLRAQPQSRETVDSVRLVVTMLLTVSAIVLGLLTSAAKAHYDDQIANLERYSVDLIELDERLRQYGPDAAKIRERLRVYTAAAIASTWPDETHPQGGYPLVSETQPAGGAESRTLGDLLQNVDRMIEDLVPANVFQQHTAERLRARVADNLQQRWRLIASHHSTISWPFLAVLMFWLVIIFASFGLTSPRNKLVFVIIVLGAASVSSSLYLIMEFDASQTGHLRIPSLSMRDALSHMDRPDASAAVDTRP